MKLAKVDSSRTGLVRQEKWKYELCSDRAVPIVDLTDNSCTVIGEGKCANKIEPLVHYWVW